MISVLFAAPDSVYKTLPDIDVWDQERNALNWPGGNRAIFHPPCRLWSRWLRHFSTAPQEEKQLALWSVEQIRKWGGVLEHPACSLLWQQAGLPQPGSSDSYGLSIAVEQRWWNHKASKATWLYICGINKLPPIPLILGEPAVRGARGHEVKHPDMQRLSKKERAATPIEFARWLVALCKAP